MPLREKAKQLFSKDEVKAYEKAEKDLHKEIDDHVEDTRAAIQGVSTKKAKLKRFSDGQRKLRGLRGPREIKGRMKRWLKDEALRRSIAALAQLKADEGLED